MQGSSCHHSDWKPLEIAHFFVSADGGFGQLADSSLCDADVRYFPRGPRSSACSRPLGAHSGPSPLTVLTVAMEVKHSGGASAAVIYRDTLASVSPSTGPDPTGLTASHWQVQNSQGADNGPSITNTSQCSQLLVSVMGAEGGEVAAACLRVLGLPQPRHWAPE